MINVPDTGIIIDRFFNEKTYNNLLSSLRSCTWEYGWQTNDNIPQYIFNKSFYDVDNQILDVDISNHLPPYVLDAWSQVNKHFNFSKLLRCYANMFLNGMDAYPHYDSLSGEDITVVVYLCGPHWNVACGGETVIYDKNNDIISSAVPRQNRIFAFKSNMLHSARSINKICEMQRITLMFKATYR